VPLGCRIFAFMFNLDLNGALRVLSRAPRGQVTLAHEHALTELWLLAGKTVSVRRDGAYGNTLLDYHETLPAGLAPLVVLDASGRVRETYRQWEKNRGGLETLSPAPKSYKNLTVHCWRTGGGKSAFRENGRTLIEGIVKTITDKPADEEWLVVYHQDGIGVNFSTAACPLRLRPCTEYRGGRACGRIRAGNQIFAYGFPARAAMNRSAHACGSCRKSYAQHGRFAAGTGME
jgi:hypothetical protein